MPASWYRRGYLLSAIYSCVAALAVGFCANDAFSWWKAPVVYTHALPANIAYGWVIGSCLFNAFTIYKRTRAQKRREAQGWRVNG